MLCRNARVLCKTCIRFLARLEDWESDVENRLGFGSADRPSHLDRSNWSLIYDNCGERCIVADARTTEMEARNCFILSCIFRSMYVIKLKLWVAPMGVDEMCVQRENYGTHILGGNKCDHGLVYGPPVPPVRGFPSGGFYKVISKLYLHNCCLLFFRLYIWPGKFD